MFVAIDKPALQPLPAESFDMAEWARARVNIDYHVSFDANLYSVPYNLVHELRRDSRYGQHGRDSAKGTASPRTCATAAVDTPSPITNTGPRAIARTWNGHRHGW